MRVHPLSDLRLDTGAYGLAPGLECDVIVVCGDVSEGTGGVEFLKSLPRPVVYVLGNKEYYAQGDEVDMEDRLREIRAAAEGSNVHVLEKDAVIIGGVRFLGTTLWTNFCGGNVDLMRAAQGRMNDYRHITARKWYARNGNREKFIKFYAGKRRSSETQKIIAKGLLDPYIVHQMHCESVAWLKSQLRQEFDGQTVVVTHHHPLFESLRRTGVSEEYLTSSLLWSSGREDGVLRVAAYASDLSRLIGEVGENIALWACGHLTTKLDYMESGIRVVCNPRGAAIHQYTKSEKDLFAMFGSPVSKEAEQNLAERLAEDPFVGFGDGFDRFWVIDLDSGLRDVIAVEAESVRTKLEVLRSEISEFGSLLITLKSANPLLVVAVREAIEERSEKFSSIFEKLCRHVFKNVTNDHFSSAHFVLLKTLGLPIAAGAIQFLADPWMSSEDPMEKVGEDVKRLLAATGAAIYSLDLLPSVVEAKRADVLNRTISIMQRAQAAGIQARFLPAKGALRSWRRIKQDVGEILCNCVEAETPDKVKRICEEIVNKDWPRVDRDFYVSVVTPKDEYLAAPFSDLYDCALTLEQLREELI